MSVTTTKKENNFIWFSNGKIEQGYALFGKTGSIRFKQALSEVMSFKPGERWLIGVTQENKDDIIIVRPKQGQEMNGFKMMYQNKSWFITAKGVAIELKLQLPKKYFVEQYSDGEYSGLILKPVK